MLNELPEAQRAVAERALAGGIPAVRQAVNEQNTRLRAEGKEEIPAAGLISIAEALLPRLRVAEWLDRADAAKSDIERLDRIGGIQKITAQHSDAGRARFTIEAEKDKNVRPEIARAIIGSGWELNELHGVSLSLENIFLELTSKQEAA